MSRNEAKDEVTSFPLVLGPKPKGRRATSPAVEPSRAPVPAPPVLVPSGLARAREAAVRAKTNESSQVGSHVFERAAPVAPPARSPIVDADPEGQEPTRTDLAMPKLPPPKMTVFGSPSAQVATRQESYRLGKVLGTGGLATVYEATKEGADNFRKRFAIKRIHAHLAQDQKLIDLLADEARLLSQIQHPNVCQVLDFVQDETSVFMVMELLVGCTLLQLFGTLRQCPEQLSTPSHQFLVARVIAGAADGLHAAHELKDERGDSLEVVHRDVTPNNLVVLSSGAVKVTDFGIARARNQAHHTATGMVKGKLCYMAPEQLHGQGVDRRTDIFALGAVMWEMLTGERLFHRSSEGATIRAICNGDVPEPATRQPSVTPALAEVVMKALRLDPRDRFQDAREMARALERAIAKGGVPVANGDVADWITEISPTGAGERATVRSALPRSSTARTTPTAEVVDVAVVPTIAPSNQIATIATGKRPWFSRALVPAAVLLPLLALGGWWSRSPAAAPAAAPTVNVARAASPAPLPVAPGPQNAPTARPVAVTPAPVSPAASPEAYPLPPIEQPSNAAAVAPTSAPAPAKPAASDAVARGSVLVSVSGAPSEISVEGRTYPSGQPISLPVGTHRLTVVRKADQMASQEIEVTVKEGASSFIPVRVEPLPAIQLP